MQILVNNQSKKRKRLKKLPKSYKVLLNTMCLSSTLVKVVNHHSIKYPTFSLVASQNNHNFQRNLTLTQMRNYKISPKRIRICRIPSIKKVLTLIFMKKKIQKNQRILLQQQKIIVKEAEISMMTIKSPKNFTSMMIKLQSK